MTAPNSDSRGGTSTASNLLVVDDDADVLQAARLLLRGHFAQVFTLESPEGPDGIDALLDAQRIDVFLLDMNFAIGRNSGAEGLHWLGQIRGRDPDAVVVLMTAFADVGTAVQAMREGATDFIMKPWQNDKLLATLSVAAQLRSSRARVAALTDHAGAHAGPRAASGFIAGAPRMLEVMRLVERAARTDANVLIRGEHGTGKELVADALHRGSARADQVLLAVDLGAVSESLFESELFGHVKGAFTDAARDRAGRFQAADGGTLFLDEVGNLSPALQARLLRVLEAREVTPVGSDTALPVDVRLIAATNMPLESMVAAGEFRADLLYRLNTIEITLPPLRERGDDIEALARHFARVHARRYGQAERNFSDDALAALATYSWPGNVRELSHAVERALILADSDLLTAEDLALSTAPPADGDVATLDLEANERRLIEEALGAAAGNISHAADALGITRAALYRRIQKHGL